MNINCKIHCHRCHRPRHPCCSAGAQVHDRGGPARGGAAQAGAL